MVRAAALIGLLLALAPALAGAKPLDYDIVSLPAVGVESEVEVGMTMISTVKVERKPTINTTATYSAKGLTIPPGEKVFSGWDGQGRFFQGPALNPLKFLGMRSDVSGGIYVYDDPWTPPEIFWWSGPGLPLKYKVPGASIVFSQTFSPDYSKTHFKRELVYSGVSRGVVSITYREFSDDMARPAFSQDLTYDLSEGSEIGFRGARFRIIRATNTGIVYTVLKPLDGLSS